MEDPCGTGKVDPIIEYNFYIHETLFMKLGWGYLPIEMISISIFYLHLHSLQTNNETYNPLTALLRWLDLRTKETLYLDLLIMHAYCNSYCVKLCCRCLAIYIVNMLIISFALNSYVLKIFYNFMWCWHNCC